MQKRKKTGDLFSSTDIKILKPEYKMYKLYGIAIKIVRPSAGIKFKMTEIRIGVKENPINFIELSRDT